MNLKSIKISTLKTLVKIKTKKQKDLEFCDIA